MARAITTTEFRAETQRRLIDTWELMHLLGLRSRQAIWGRVEKGTLPAPVIVRERSIAFWDKDEIADLAGS